MASPAARNFFLRAARLRVESSSESYSESESLVVLEGWEGWSLQVVLQGLGF